MDAKPGGRDGRVDAVRGLALLMIFVNHTVDTVYNHLTTANYGPSDAAEIFVLLAGWSAAHAYLSMQEGRGWLPTAVRVWRRAFDLYAAHLVTVLVACAAVAAAAIAWDDPRLLAWINFGPVFEDTAAGLLGVVTLGHQPGMLNILPMYVCFLAALPLALPLAARRPTAFLAASGALYAAANGLGLNLPHFPNEDSWFFNPLAWQFLFAIGFVLGHRARAGLPPAPAAPWLFPAAAAFVAAAAALEVGGVALPPLPALPYWLYEADKTFLTAPRLLHVLALALVASRLGVPEALARADRTGTLALLGRHSLPVFCLGSVLAMVGQIARFDADGGFLLDSALVFGGIGLQVALARVLGWLESERRTSAARRAGPVAAGGA